MPAPRIPVWIGCKYKARVTISLNTGRAPHRCRVLWAPEGQPPCALSGLRACCSPCQPRLSSPRGCSQTLPPGRLSQPPARPSRALSRTVRLTDEIYSPQVPCGSAFPPARAAPRVWPFHQECREEGEAEDAPRTAPPGDQASFSHGIGQEGAFMTTRILARARQARKPLGTVRRQECSEKQAAGHCMPIRGLSQSRRL